MSVPNIETSRNGQVLTLRLQRPEKKNALTSAMYLALAQALAAADANDDIRVIVIAGGADFTAGNDLQEFVALAGQPGTPPVVEFLKQISQARKPIVAAVRGLAIGIGTTLLLHCDAAIVAANARFQLPFAALGLVPEAASSLLLPLTVGRMKASQWLLAGEVFDAAAAERAGLVSEVVAEDAVENRAAELAGRIASLPPAAVRASKALIRQPQQDAVASVMAAEMVQFFARLSSAEAQEAFAAFAQKRRPDFSRFS